MNYKKHFLYILLCINTLALGACGIKPPYVDPPQGAQHDTFPQTYPDSRTDPKSGLGRSEL